MLTPRSSIRRYFGLGLSILFTLRQSCIGSPPPSIRTVWFIVMDWLVRRNESGRSITRLVDDLWVESFTIYTCCCTVSNLKLALEYRLWNIFHYITMIWSIVGWIVFLYIESSFTRTHVL